MGLIVKGMLAVFWLLFVPFAAGIGFYQRKEQRQIKNPGVCLLTGYTILFMGMEILTLPMIFFKLPLHVLAAAYGCFALALAAYGCLALYRKKKRGSEGDDFQEMSGLETSGMTDVSKRPGGEPASNPGKAAASGKHFSWEMATAILLILLQIAVLVFYAHMDADDSFYVGTATTAVQTDTIFEVNPYTGALYQALPRRYVLSPFPVFLAVVSRLCAGLHPAIVAHTIFPAVFLFLAYLVLYQYSSRFFKEDMGKKGMFMLLCSVLIWFSGYSVYNSETFTMVRIWQGKAVLAGVMLPWLFFLCMEIMGKEKPEYPWSTLFLTNGACCLLSSMGIMLAPLMMGCFILINLIKFRDSHRFFKSIVCCLPSLILGAAYILVF